VALSLGLALLWIALSKRGSPAPVALARPSTQNACDTLQSRLCGELGEASSACALARRETRSFSTARCQSMLGRFAQVAFELRELDVGTHELTAQEQHTLHGEAPQLGPPDAALSLVVFSDFQSSDCARAAPMASVVTNLYPARVRVVFRQYPSPKHPDAHLAAEASLAAQAQGKFWPYHDVLFANPQDLQRAALERYASDVGLDLAAFRHDLDTRRFAADVDADIELGHKLQALERPSVFANGQPVTVPYGVAELSKLIDATLALHAQR
jgi:predicted DsbA family dithiol-disulfide isomerase